MLWCYWSIIMSRSTVWIAAGGEDVQTRGRWREKWKQARAPCGQKHSENRSLCLIMVKRVRLPSTSLIKMITHLHVALTGRKSDFNEAKINISFYKLKTEFNRCLNTFIDKLSACSLCSVRHWIQKPMFNNEKIQMFQFNAHERNKNHTDITLFFFYCILS